MTNKDKELTKQLIKDLNNLIIKYHGNDFIGTERDDLCNVRWILENKLKSNIVVKDSENFWKSGAKCS